MEDGYAARHVYRQLRFGSSEEEDEEEDEIEEVEELNRPAAGVSGGGGGGVKLRCSNSIKLDDCSAGNPSKLGDWSEEASIALLHAWAQKCRQLQRSNLKMEHWTEVARAVTARSNAAKTDVQCKNRLDTLKKRYKQEKHKVAAGTYTGWLYFNEMNRILSSLDPKQQQRQQQQQQRQQQQQPRAPQIVDAAAAELLMNRPAKSLKHKLEWSDISEADEKEQQQQAKRAKTADSSSESCQELLRTAVGMFGAIFERLEMSKQRSMMELERMRMQFTRDLELQRTKLLMETKLELAKLKHGRR